MPATRIAAAALALALGAGAGAADVPAQERRLVDLHALLLDLPPVQAPGALPPWTLSAGLEVVGIPRIDGRVGDTRELTASDHTRIYPRPRLQLGLPAPGGLRAFAGLAYVPPFTVREVTSHDLAVEAGLALAPGRLRLGLRLHALASFTRAPVTDPGTRDVLQVRGGGADAAAGVALRVGRLELTPYAGAGLVHLQGRFRVTADGTVLHGTQAGAALQAGVRLAAQGRWELVAEVAAYPARLYHTDVRLGWLFGR